MQFNGFFLTALISLLVSTANAARAEFTTSQYEQAVRQALDFESRLQLDAAAKILEETLANASEAGRTDWTASILGLLGTIYERSGRYADAEVDLSKAISEWTQLEGAKTPNLVGPLAGLAGLYYEASEYTRAEQLLSRALELELSSGNSTRLTAMLLTNLASVYFGEHKDTLARQNAETALDKFALVADPREGTARNYSLLGAVALRGGNMTEAEAYLETALSLWEAMYGANDPHTAEGLGNLAIFYAANRQLEKSEPLFRRAKTAFDTVGGSKAFLCDLYGHYAEVERLLGHKKEAKGLEKEVRQLAMTGAQHTISRNVVDASAFSDTRSNTKGVVQNPLH
jgi:tetratricopeptide (TPR) repeat protein